MNDADLVIIDGLHLEGGMEKVVDEAKNKNPQMQLLKLGDNTIAENQWIYDFSFPKEKGDPNPTSLAECCIRNEICKSHEGQADRNGFEKC